VTPIKVKILAVSLCLLLWIGIGIFYLLDRDHELFNQEVPEISVEKDFLIENNTQNLPFHFDNSRKNSLY